MKRYSAIIFDLDGTLTDPAEGIINSVCYALRKYGIEEKNTEKLLKFIGPPLNRSFEKNYDFSSKEAKQAVDYYREYYTENGLSENKIYPGIQNVLQYLSSKGCSLFVGTSKPTVYAKKILKNFDLEQFFTDIIGSNLDLTRVVKGEIIEHILITHKLSPKENIVMIGDTHFDIEGAYFCGIDSVHVRYGYGNSEKVEKHNPTYSIMNMEELYQFFKIHT